MNRAFFNLILAAVLAVPASLAAAENGEWTLGDFTVTLSDKEPPKAVDAKIREQLTPQAFTVSDPDGVLFEFWFVKTIAMAKIEEDPKKILDGVAPMTLLGAANVPEEDRVLDFREDPVDPSAYTMRMATQPQDGDHMGTAPTDTFAALIYAERDQGIDTFDDHEHMIDVSREDTIAEHPPILYMQYDEEGGEYPRLTKGGEGNREWYILCLKLPATIDGKDTELAFQLIFDGFGDL